MGNTNEKNNMSSIILSDKVESLNKLTNSILFYKKTGYKLSFKPQEKNVFDDIFEKLPFVDVNVYSFSNKEKYLMYSVKISAEDAIKFYEITIKSTKIFMDLIKKKDESLNNNNNNSSHSKTKEIIKKCKSNDSIVLTEDDNSLCTICEDKKANIMLPCYHCFCCVCIESWLFNKRNHCPLCRNSVDLENYDTNTWDIIDYTKEDRIKDANEEFNIIFNRLFLNNNKLTKKCSK